jgi:hypothetical protein
LTTYKFEIRTVVRFLQAEGGRVGEIHPRLVSVYSQKEVSLWCKIFKDGQMAVKDGPEKHRGRPRTPDTEENCVIVESLVREDRRIKVHEIA